MTQLDQTDRQMIAKFDGKCSLCSGFIAAGTPIIYNFVIKRARHADCGAAKSAPAAPSATSLGRKLTDDEIMVIEDYLNNTVSREHVRNQIAWTNAGKPEWKSAEMQAALKDLSEAVIDAAIKRVERWGR